MANTQCVEQFVFEDGLCLEGVFRLAQEIKLT